MTSLKITPILYKPAKAVEVAAELKKGDPEWDYKVIHDPKGTGYSYIEIYDEDGEYVGEWGTTL